MSGSARPASSHSFSVISAMTGTARAPRAEAVDDGARGGTSRSRRRRCGWRPHQHRADVGGQRHAERLKPLLTQAPTHIATRIATTFLTTARPRRRLRRVHRARLGLYERDLDGRRRARGAASGCMPRG